MHLKEIVILVVLAIVLSCVEARNQYKYQPITTTPRPTTRPTTPPRTIRLSQCGVVTREDLLNNSMPSGKFICAQPTEHKLLKILKNIGGYNPRYVAMNESDAQNFKDPRLFSSAPVPTSSTTTTAKTTTQPPTTLPPYRRRRTRPYRRRRTRPTYPWRRRRTRRRHWQRKRRAWGLGDDSAQTQEKENDQSNNDFDDTKINDEHVPVLTKRAIEGKKICRDRGALIYTETSSSRNVSTNRYRLCGECHVVTHLASNFRPSYLNELICKHKVSPANTSGSVQEDEMCAWNSGLCIQRQVMFPAIRLTDMYEMNQELSNNRSKLIYSQMYDVEDKEIRTSCQCQVFSNTVQKLNDD